MKHINLDFIGFNNILSSAWFCISVLLYIVLMLIKEVPVDITAQSNPAFLYQQLLDKPRVPDQERNFKRHYFFIMLNSNAMLVSKRLRYSKWKQMWAWVLHYVLGCAQRGVTGEEGLQTVGKGSGGDSCPGVRGTLCTTAKGCCFQASLFRVHFQRGMSTRGPWCPDITASCDSRSAVVQQYWL